MKIMKKIAIIGGGPAGVMAGIVAMQNNKSKINDKLEITIFDKSDPLKTLLYTGGGRCNLSYSEFDYKKLAQFFPRGEKFLLSPFSRFGSKDTQEFFLKLGLKTYTQDDNRIFPVSNDANDVRGSLLKNAENLGIKFKKLEIFKIVKSDDGFLIFDTENNTYKYDKIVIATGGNRLKSKFSGYSLAESLGHSIIKLKPALCGLKIKEEWCKKLSGLSFKNLKGKAIFNGKKIKDIEGDLLFTHKGISGPLSYKTSSYCADCNFSNENPLILEINFIGKPLDIFDKEFTLKINENQKKKLSSIVSEYTPKSMAKVLLEELGLDIEITAGSITREERKKVAKALTENQLNIISSSAEGEVVTAGGINLSEIDNRTMESKLVNGLYFCGEIIDVDGLTGGFNLQHCWTSGYIVGMSII